MYNGYIGGERKLKIIQSDLKTILDQRGLSIRQVSRDINYRFDSVRQMYNDEIERYPRDLISKLCNYLNIETSDLLKLKDKEEAPE